MELSTFDCFTFFNELELLELRLNELKDVVDQFILVESPITHSGKQKPLYYEDNKERFSAYPIHHVVYVPPIHCTSWYRENMQREEILRGLTEVNAQDDDYVMVSDLDEIPNSEIVGQCVEGRYHQRMFYFYMDLEDPSTWISGTIGARYQYVRQVGPQAFRVQKYGFPLIENGGWHFSYIGGSDRVKTKLTSFAHIEYSGIETLSIVDDQLAKGEDIFGRNHTYQKVSLDDHPKYVLENLEKFEKFLF